ARTIEEGKNENEIIIDGQVYTYDIDDEVAIDYFESSERDLKEVRREARRLYKEFKKRGKNELLAFLENDTPDFYVASIIALEKEE
ncbi:MAG: hypothetical protein QXJ93_02325, partial [Candidatus Rehaiarchaeum fermentans]|nr:hypothetical protein [Candidatus Rehaiarchaeum fermentans]